MILVVAEKPSVGRNIAAIVGANKTEDGYIEGNNYIVTWAVGHLIGLYEPNDYSEEWAKWSVEQLPIVPERWKTKVLPSTAKQYKVIEKLINRPDLEYVIPKEGSNMWIDSWVIPKNAKNKENAEAFINFMCRPDIAKMNFDYITYSIPNEEGRKLLDSEYRNNPIVFPDDKALENCETFKFLGDENDAIYNELWRQVKSK